MKSGLLILSISAALATSACTPQIHIQQTINGGSSSGTSKSGGGTSPSIQAVDGNGDILADKLINNIGTHVQAGTDDLKTNVGTAKDSAADIVQVPSDFISNIHASFSTDPSPSPSPSETP